MVEQELFAVRVAEAGVNDVAAKATEGVCGEGRDIDIARPPLVFGARKEALEGGPSMLSGLADGFYEFGSPPGLEINRQGGEVGVTVVSAEGVYESMEFRIVENGGGQRGGRVTRDGIRGCLEYPGIPEALEDDHCVLGGGDNIHVVTGHHAGAALVAEVHFECLDAWHQGSVCTVRNCVFAPVALDLVDVQGDDADEALVGLADGSELGGAIVWDVIFVLSDAGCLGRLGGGRLGARGTADRGRRSCSLERPGSLSHQQRATSTMVSVPEMT